MRDRVVAQRDQLVASARQHQEQRQHERDEDQPRRYLDVDRDAAGECAQHETDRDRDNVDDHLVLGPQRIKELKRGVQHGDSQERAAQYDAQHDRNRGQHQRGAGRRGNREIAARQRPVALFGIQPVGVAVGDVVENVAGARQCAERDERDDRQHDVVEDEQPLAEHQRRQHQRVLDPLMGPREAHHRGQLAGALDCRSTLVAAFTALRLYRCALCSSQDGRHLTASRVCENSTLDEYFDAGKNRTVRHGRSQRPQAVPR